MKRGELYFSSSWHCWISFHLLAYYDWATLQYAWTDQTIPPQPASWLLEHQHCPLLSPVVVSGALVFNNTTSQSSMQQWAEAKSSLLGVGYATIKVHAFWWAGCACIIYVLPEVLSWFSKTTNNLLQPAIWGKQRGTSTTIVFCKTYIQMYYNTSQCKTGQNPTFEDS